MSKGTLAGWAPLTAWHDKQVLVERFNSIYCSNCERREIRFEELGERQYMTHSWERSVLDAWRRQW
jgi:hypothetical protein